MSSSAKQTPSSSAPTATRNYGLQHLESRRKGRTLAYTCEGFSAVSYDAGRLSNARTDKEGEILALIAVAAGLKTSLLLPLCCVSLQQSLASPVMDNQLFGRLCAALARVENPGDALLHPPPPPPSCYPKDVHRRRFHNADTSSSYPRNVSAQFPPSSPMPRPLSQTQSGTKRAHSCSSHSDEASAAAEDTPVRDSHRLPSGCPLSETGSPATEVRSSEGNSGREMSASLNVDDDLRRNRFCGETISSTAPRSSAQAAVARTSERCNSFHTSWKARLMRDLATGRKPTEAFVFSGQHIGKQDVLMTVVPSSPPVIAVACTTELSLFNLDGARLPAVTCCALSREKDAAALGRPIGGDEHAVRGEGAGRQRAGAIERHERDIRCLSGSPSGDMVATGSLDCTIRVRSVPECAWVRRLRGHEFGVRCLVFCRSRLVSADSVGVMSVWDVYPDVRRLQAVQGHTDSVQVLTWTGGAEQLASGALDGSVVIWSVSRLDGTLTRTVAYGGLCHPYGLVAVGRCLAFTSSSDLGTLASSGLVAEDDDNNNSHLATSRGSHISVVALSGGPIQHVCTGQARTHHLAAGGCIGAVMVSPMEAWSCDNEGSSEDDEVLSSLVAGERRGDYTPRLCHIVSTGTIVVSTVEQRIYRGFGKGGGERLDGTMTGGTTEDGAGARVLDWVEMLQSRVQSLQCTGTQNVDGKYPKGNISTDVMDAIYKGLGMPRGGKCLEHSSGGALCTCVVFVGRTLFLGFDTGGVWAHRVSDGARLYRLSAGGPLVHLVEAGGSLFAYASSGMVSRWTWEDR